MMRSVEQMLKLDDVMVVTSGQKPRVTLGEDLCVCVLVCDWEVCV